MVRGLKAFVRHLSLLVISNELPDPMLRQVYVSVFRVGVLLSTALILFVRFSLFVTSRLMFSRAWAAIRRNHMKLLVKKLILPL